MPRLNQPKKLGKMIQTVNVPKSDNFSQVWAFLNTDQDRKKKKKSSSILIISCKYNASLSLTFPKTQKLERKTQNG